MTRATIRRNWQSVARGLRPRIRGVSAKGRATDSPRDEQGAILVLALVFLIVVGGIVGVMANSVTSHLNDSVSFASARSLQYTATSAVNLAIQDIRYNPLMSNTLNASPPSYCWGPPSEVTLNATSQVDVYCSTEWNPYSSTTRLVTISACLDTEGGASVCAAKPLLQAVVAFDDYPTGVSTPSTAQCSTYCGTGMTITSWLWSPSLPTITSFNNFAGSNPISGHTLITIGGTGFVSGATTVNFVQESGGVPVGNEACPSTITSTTTSTCLSVNPTSVTPTSITVYSPAVTTGPSYFVTVTTPTGTTAYGPTFVYSPSQPSVSGVCVAGVTPCTSPTSAYSSGGDQITITGTGFFGTPTVNLVEESGGTPSSPLEIYPASYVSVQSSTTLIAVLPGVIQGSTYFVQVVTTLGGASTYGGNSDVVNFKLPVPIVESVSTPVGNSFTVTGTGFYSGATVSLPAQDSCNNFNSFGTPKATNVMVNSSSSINGTFPSGLSPGTYCVAVTTSGGTSSNSVDVVNP